MEGSRLIYTFYLSQLRCRLVVAEEEMVAAPHQAALIRLHPVVPLPAVKLPLVVPAVPTSPAALYLEIATTLPAVRRVAPIKSVAPAA